MEMTLLYVYMKEFIQYLSYIRTQFKFFWNHLETKALPFCIHEVKVLIFFKKRFDPIFRVFLHLCVSSNYAINIYQIVSEIQL